MRRDDYYCCAVQLARTSHFLALRSQKINDNGQHLFCLKYNITNAVLLTTHVYESAKQYQNFYDPVIL